MTDFYRDTVNELIILGMHFTLIFNHCFIEADI